jgi:hypothetical protein
VALLWLGCAVSPALACPDGYYEANFPPVCLPTDTTVYHSPAIIPPLPDIIHVGQAVVHANIDELTKSVGALIVNNDCGIVCQTFLANVLQPKDKEVLEELVGRGFLMWLSDSDAAVLLGFPATSAAAQFIIRRSRPEPGSEPPMFAKQKERSSVTYKADNALCLITSPNGKRVFAWWSKLPHLTGKDGKVVPIDSADLRKGDFIEVSASPCKGDSKLQQKSITGAKIKFTGDPVSIVSNPTPDAIHYTLSGDMT